MAEQVILLQGVWTVHRPEAQGTAGGGRNCPAGTCAGGPGTGWVLEQASV